MVRAGKSTHVKKDLHFIETGTLTADRYNNEILDVYVRTYAGVALLCLADHRPQIRYS